MRYFPHPDRTAFFPGSRFSLFLFLVLGTGLAGCHSGVREGGGPAWVHQPSRTVDNGYIVYLGTGEDRLLERASFKAESEAIGDLANECSFPPKGARIEDHYDEPLPDGGHRAYAKLAVVFEECEEAKRASDPSAIRAAASVQMAAQLKQYQQLIQEPDPGAPGMVKNDLATASNPAASSGGETGVRGEEGWHGPVPFLVYRQQLAYLKQQVILSPPGNYPPNSAATTQFVQTVRPATTSIQNFEMSHPEMTKTTTTWSRYPGKPRALAPRFSNSSGSTHLQSTPAFRRGNAGSRFRGGYGRRRRRH